MNACHECGNSPLGRTGGPYRHPTVETARICSACYKRLRWRPADGEAQERERAYSRRWKAENREANLARDRAYNKRNATGTCACGNCIYDGDTVCGDCERQQAAVLRRQRIVALWASGESIRGIADALGSTPNSIGTEMSHMRQAGYDLPYRRAWKLVSA